MYLQQLIFKSEMAKASKMFFYLEVANDVTLCNAHKENKHAKSGHLFALIYLVPGMMQ